MITEELKEIINLLYKKYVYLVQDLPQINLIKESSDLSCEAQFSVDDLYSKKYILYVDPDIEQECLQFKENILFHEFTHMADSIKYSYLSPKDFQDFMFIYSEVHASEIQMNCMLATQENKPYSLDQQIIHKGYISLRKWMNQTLDHVAEEFALPDTGMPLSSLYDLRDLFYFIGYLKSLQKNNISYNYDYSRIPHLKEAFDEITELMLNEQVNPTIIISYYRKLESQVKKTLFEHKQMLLNSLSALMTDYDNTISDTIAFLKRSTPKFDEKEFMRKLSEK